MVNYTQLTSTDLNIIIRYKINEQIHIHRKDITFDEIDADYTFPKSINPTGDFESFYSQFKTEMDRWAIIIHRLHIAEADLFLKEIKDEHYIVSVRFSKTNLDKDEKGREFHQNLDESSSVDNLNELFDYFERHPIADNMERVMVSQRIDQKYVKLYLNSPNTRPEWKGKLIQGVIGSIEIDIQDKEMVINYNDTKYTATVHIGLQFTDTTIPVAVLDIFNKYIIDEVADACRRLYQNYPVALITNVV